MHAIFPLQNPGKVPSDLDKPCDGLLLFPMPRWCCAEAWMVSGWMNAGAGKQVKLQSMMPLYGEPKNKALEETDP